MVDLPRNQISELQFDKFLILQHFSDGRRISRPRYALVQELTYGCYVVDQRSGSGQISGRAYDVATNKRDLYSRTV